VSGPPSGRMPLPPWDAADVWAGLFAEARSPEARCKVVWLRAEAAGGRVLGNGMVRLPPGLAGAALGSLRTQALLAGVTLWEAGSGPSQAKDAGDVGR
jgi:hypothetical protein